MLQVNIADYRGSVCNGCGIRVAVWSNFASGDIYIGFVFDNDIWSEASGYLVTLISLAIRRQKLAFGLLIRSCE